MRIAGLVLVAVFGVAGCSEAFLDLRGESLDIPLPRSPGGTSTPTQTPVETPTPVPPDYGDGHDGVLSLGMTSMSVNQCRELTSASGTMAVVVDAVPFPVGRRVLVHQVQDDVAGVGAADLNDLTVATMGGVGLWKIGRVIDVVGTTLTLDSSLGASVSYSSSGTRQAQVCTVPEYTTVTVPAGGTIAASGWGGVSGGVVAFYASSFAQLDGLVDADSEGFRGGARSQEGGGGDVTADTTSSSQGGGRGESVDGRSLGANGRGQRGNGAGGGNNHNAGGGGGGGAASGGEGGFNGEGAATNNSTRGRHGHAILMTGPERLVFGGGGGGGQSDDVGGAAGNAGGGIILVFAYDFRGAGVFDVDGGDGFDTTDVDGAGGGGAGGMIILRAETATFTGTLSAEGGNGGTADGTAVYGAGPGGGGGGGRIVLPAVIASNATFELGGGTAGFLQGETSNAFGSTGGSVGIIDIW